MNDLKLNQKAIVVHGLGVHHPGRITKIESELIEITDGRGITHTFNEKSGRRAWQSYNIHFRTDIERFEAEQNDLSVRFGEDEWTTPQAKPVTRVSISDPHQRYINAFQPDAFGQDNI